MRVCEPVHGCVCVCVCVCRGGVCVHMVCYLISTSVSMLVHHGAFSDGSFCQRGLTGSGMEGCVWEGGGGEGGRSAA